MTSKSLLKNLYVNEELRATGNWTWRTSLNNGNAMSSLILGMTLNELKATRHKK